MKKTESEEERNDFKNVVNKTLGRARDPRANGAWLNN